MRVAIPTFCCFFLFVVSCARPIHTGSIGQLGGQKMERSGSRSLETWVQDPATAAKAHHPHRIVRRAAITMISSAPTTRSATAPPGPSATVTAGPTDPTHTADSTTPDSGIAVPKLAGIIAGGVVLLIAAVSLLAFCLHRRRKAAAVQRRSAEHAAGKAKSLEFLTVNLEASSNPWNFSPVNTVNSSFPSEGKRQAPGSPPQLPPFKTEARGSVTGLGFVMNKITAAPIIPAATLSTVVETPASPKPVAQKRRSSISQAVRKMSATFASIVASSSPTENAGHKDHSEMNGTFGTRNTPSPWAWGNSINGREPVTPVDYLGRGTWDMDIDPLAKEVDVEELVGVAITERERPVRPGVITKGIPPPPNPPPTSALPAPPKPIATAMPYPPTSKARKRPLPTMTIPVPSATATATANLATFTLLHQSLSHASTGYTSGCSPTGTLSPASSTRYTYCEGMSPTSPASHFCATNHSSCVWSCSSAAGTPRSSRHTLSLYSVPPTPGNRISSRGGQCSSHSSSGYFTSASDTPPPPLPTSTITSGKPRGIRPGPLNLSQKKRNPQRDHLAGELAELPPSPRRLPEEIEKVTREMRGRQQEEVLRRLFGEVPKSAGIMMGGSGTGTGTGSRARSGSVTGVYGGSWPDRI